MDVLAGKILALFGSFNKETLDLHELFEAGGNDPDARTAVLDRVERLVREDCWRSAAMTSRRWREKVSSLSDSTTKISLLPA